MRFMLDTCTVIYGIKKKESVIKRILSHDPDDLCISSITYAELMYGINKSEKKDLNLMALILFLSSIKIIPFDESSSEEYGVIYSDLEKKGASIGKMDALIAGHAKSRGCVLVTDNTREFNRIQGLRVENWC